MAVSVPTRQRISRGTEMFMGAVAWSVYGVDFLINILGDWFGIGEIVSFIFMVSSFGAFAFWFAGKGVSLFSGKMIKEFWGQGILSFIPIVNVFAFNRTKNGLIEPNIRARVRRVIEITREEDAEYNLRQAAKAERRLPQNVVRYKKAT